MISVQKRKSSRVSFFFRKYFFLNLLALPCVLFFVLFKYVPMYGIILAFKDYKGTGGLAGILNAPWVGMRYFMTFFNSIYFTRLTTNTIVLSFYRLLFGFPAPILLALLINEVMSRRFKRVVQTITYMPHFLSWVVVSGLLITLLSPTSGPVNGLLGLLGIEPIFFIGSKDMFRGVLVASDIWKSVGWGTIIYLAAITSINPEMYEAARIDGANRFQQVTHITLPAIAEIISIMLILAAGRILDENFEQIMTLYSEAVYSVADVYETYIYRQGVMKAQFSYTTAVGLFKSVVSLVLVIISNALAKKLGSSGLW